MAHDARRIGAKQIILHFRPVRGQHDQVRCDPVGDGEDPAMDAAGFDMMFDGLGSSASHIKGGRIKALAVASPKRAPGFPDLPTSAEAGVPTYQVSTWYGLWAPKGMPREIVERMQAEMTKVFATPQLQSTWTGLGTEVPNLYGEAYGKFVSGEIRRWAEVVKASGAKLD